MRHLQLNSTRNRWMITGYLILLHLVLGIAIFKTDFIPKVKVRLGLAAATPDVHLPNMRRVFDWMDASVPEGSVIFLGDSIVQSTATAAVVDRAVNYGIGGMNTAQLVDLLPRFQSLPRARALVLLIGINDIIYGQHAELEQHYQQVLAQLPKNTPLVWSSLLPTLIAEIPRDQIISANATIQRLCAQRGNCTFVDTWQLFNTSPKPLDQLLLPDRIHPSAEGYALLINALRNALPANS